MIPKIIHYCWFGGNPLPELAQKCIASWKKYCPDYEIIEWNEANYDVSKCAYMKEAYQAKKWGFVPDYARFDIIHNHGGIYLDTDVEIIRSLDGLLENRAFMGFESENYVNPGLIIGGEAGSGEMECIMRWYETHHFMKESGEIDLTASPAIVTKWDGSVQGAVCAAFERFADDLSEGLFLPDGLLHRGHRRHGQYIHDSSLFRIVAR